MKPTLYSIVQKLFMDINGLNATLRDVNVQYRTTKLCRELTNLMYECSQVLHPPEPDEHGDLMDYIEFEPRPTPAHGLIYEHATLPTFQFAYYFEVLLNGNHPDHDTVVAFAHQLMERASEEKLAKGRETMDQTRAACTDAEWSRIVD